MAGAHPDEAAPRLRLGISSCLLGRQVRYDGGHKRDRFLTDTLGRWTDWVPVCPEVECGLPTPREAMRLVGDPAAPRLLTIKTGRDITPQMQRWLPGRLAELAEEELVGYIFKSGSPSSGMERIKVYRSSEKGAPAQRVGVGLFARAFMQRFPLLPVEDEGRLHDPGLRENFIERIFALQRYRRLYAGRRSAGKLVDFHSDHKLQLMAHSPKLLKAMGQLVARAKQLPVADLFAAYEKLLLECLGVRATVRRNVNALQHMAGYFKKQLTADERAELVEVIERYRLQQVPLIVPVTLIRHHVRRFQQPYLGRQTYLAPHPLELKLRNHA